MTDHDHDHDPDPDHTEAIRRIRERYHEVANDDRLAMEPANVMVNAPLALIQVEKQAQADALEWVLELLDVSVYGDVGVDPSEWGDDQ